MKRDEERVDLAVIDEHRATTVPATLSGTSVRLASDALESALGWHIEERGLCRNDTCLALTRTGDLVNDSGVDLTGLANLLERPLVLDVGERVAALAAPASERRRRLLALEAPDFRLPDIDGRMHSLVEQRGKKVLLLAHASW